MGGGPLLTSALGLGPVWVLRCRLRYGLNVSLFELWQQLVDGK